jgi:hypothetical protein
MKMQENVNYETEISAKNESSAFLYDTNDIENDTFHSCYNAACTL